MPRVTFTPNLHRHVNCPPQDVDGHNVGEVLAQVFARLNPAARGYILDEQGEVRTHVVIFVDGVPIRDRRTLTDPVSANSDVYIMQALSGG